LFHETRLLCARIDSQKPGERTEKSLHDELASKGEEDGVEGDKGKVSRALAILNWCRRVIGWLARDRIGEEEGRVDGIGGTRIGEV